MSDVIKSFFDKKKKIYVIKIENYHSLRLGNYGLLN